MSTTEDIAEHIAHLEEEKRRLELRIASFDGWQSRAVSAGGSSKSLGYAGIESDRRQLVLVKRMIAEAKASLANASAGDIVPRYAEFT